MRQGVKWHNKAPVNGRAMTMDDVVFSWDRLAAKGSARSGIVNTVSPERAGALVHGDGLADGRQSSSRSRWSTRWPCFGGTTNGGMVIVPKETDTTFDPRQDMIGTGPFMLTNYTQSVGFNFKRNPDYWDKDWALVDTIEMPIVTEYAAGAGAAQGRQHLPIRPERPRTSTLKTSCR